MAEKFAIISSLEPLQRGDTFESWPLHVTVMTWFSLPTHQERAFDNALRNRMHDIKPFEVTGAKQELFGPDSDVPVRLLGRVGMLGSLHNQILPVIERMSGEIIPENSDFVGDGYRPHITDQPHGRFGEGETVLLDSMQLISGDTDGPRKVLETYNFLKGRK